MIMIQYLCVAVMGAAICRILGLSFPERNPVQITCMAAVVSWLVIHLLLPIL